MESVSICKLCGKPTNDGMEYCIDCIVDMEIKNITLDIEV